MDNYSIRSSMYYFTLNSILTHISISMDTIQHDQKFFNCSDFGMIKFDSMTSVTNNNNNNNNNKHFISYQNDQFVIHDQMFCYYRRSDSQIFGGTIECKMESNLNNNNNNNNNNRIQYAITVLFRMTIPVTEDSTVAMFPDGSSKTAFLSVQQKQNIFCLYLRPMNDVYINMRYEITNAYKDKMVVSRSGDTVCYLKDDGDTICVMKVGQYGSGSSFTSHHNVEYNIKKAIAKRKMTSDLVMDSDYTSAFQSYDSYSISTYNKQPKKRMRKGYVGYEKPELTYSDYNNWTSSNNFRTVAIIQSGTTIACVQQNTQSTIRVVNVVSGEQVELGSQNILRDQVVSYVNNENIRGNTSSVMNLNNNSMMNTTVVGEVTKRRFKLKTKKSPSLVVNGSTFMQNSIANRKRKRSNEDDFCFE
jgi:hypothetical protein